MSVKGVLCVKTIKTTCKLSFLFSPHPYSYLVLHVYVFTLSTPHSLFACPVKYPNGVSEGYFTGCAFAVFTSVFLNLSLLNFEIV